MTTRQRMAPKGLKRLYADVIKIWNTGYGAILGRFSGVLNLFFTIATFFLVKSMDLSYTELVLIGIGVFAAIMIGGYLYLKFGFQKAEFSSNFIEQPELHEMYLRLQRMEEMLKKMQPKEETAETKEYKEFFQ
jgi:hypothetical protein